MNAKVESGEVGLIAGLNLLNFFIGTRDLHYGLWQDDLEVSAQNLPEARRRYPDFRVGRIPATVKRILDVGRGAVGLASELRARGYEVEGVSPNPLLSDAARRQAGEGSRIHEGRFEDIEFDDDRFELVMSGESFQYITLDTGLGDAMRRIGTGAYILICDFFKTGAPGKPVIRGGHPVAKFDAAPEESGLEVLEDIDITRETAPNLDLIDKTGRELLYPNFNLIGYAFGSNHSWLARILRWKYRKKFDKVYREYLSGGPNAQSFARHKVNRLLLLRKRED